MPSSSFSGNHRVSMIRLARTMLSRPLPEDPIRVAILTILFVGILLGFLGAVMVTSRLAATTSHINLQRKEASQ